MNIIKIFIASSLDFKKDRKELEVFFSRKNKELIKKNYFVELVIWEDFISTISKSRLQDKYNDAIQECDIFLMLFHNKIGTFTLEEFEIAYSHFLINGKPKILTYKKRTSITVNDKNKEGRKELFNFLEKLNEIEHYTSSYQNIDELKVQLYDYLEKEKLIASSGNQQGSEFSSNIKKGSNAFNLKLDKLTKEQFNAIKMFRHFKKARVSGCAGSGKTLIAVEKATRLSEAGLSTIILCHSPYLAEYIKTLTKGKSISVFSFEDWVYRLINKKLSSKKKWTQFSEPTKDELTSALNYLKTNKILFDAIIIDEAQDFRLEWWKLIDAIMSKSDNDILYIFHDDNQALLPHRATYPIKDTIIDLSKNCRNSGEVYEYLRANLHHSAPSPSEELKGSGEISIIEYSNTNLTSKIRQAIKWLSKIPNNKNIVILLAGDITFNDINIKTITTKNMIGSNWRSEIQLLFLKALNNSKKIKTDFTKNKLLNYLDNLSNNSVPTNADIRLVSEIANQFYISPKIKAMLTSNKKLNTKLYWKNKNGIIRLFSKRSEFAIQPTEIIFFFQNKNWAKGIYYLEHYDIGNEIHSTHKNYIPAIKTSLFKGLEADSIILIVRNKSHDLEKELYVAVSRAKHNLVILTDTTNKYYLDKKN